MLNVHLQEGGGLPVVGVPVLHNDGTMGVGDGIAVEKLLLPSLIREKLLHVDRIKCQITSVVSNPGGLTYQVACHRATVTFERGEEGELLMRWRVAIVPLDGWETLVRSFTEGCVKLVARNFQYHRPTTRVGIFQLPNPDDDTPLGWGTPSGFRTRWLNGFTP